MTRELQLTFIQFQVSVGAREEVHGGPVGGGVAAGGVGAHHAEKVPGGDDARGGARRGGKVLLLRVQETPGRLVILACHMNR